MTLYRFKLKNGESIELETMLSFQETGNLWKEHGGRADMKRSWGFKFKENDDEWNRQLMLMSLLLVFQPNQTLGTGNPELEKLLTMIMFSFR